MIDPVRAAFTAGAVADALRHAAWHLRQADTDQDLDEFVGLLETFADTLTGAYGNQFSDGDSPPVPTEGESE